MTITGVIDIYDNGEIMVITTINGSIQMPANDKHYITVQPSNGENALVTVNIAMPLE